MKKTTGLIVLCGLLGASSLFAGGASQSELTIYGLKGPSGVGMIQLFETPPEISGFAVQVEALADSQAMAAQLISGKAKVGILPPNVAAKIASTGKPIQIAAITGQGMLSLLSGDASVKTIADVKGKTISVAGQGAVPEYVFRKVLLAHNIDPDKDVKLDFSLAYPEIAQSLIAGRIQLALLPEPFATMASTGNKDLKTVGDIQDEWAKASGVVGNYPLTVLVVNADFAKKNPAAIGSIMQAVESSIAWVTANPADAGILVEKHNLGLKAPIVSASIPRSNYIFADAPTARPQLEALFNAFLEFAPDSIGGTLPGDTFYFTLNR